MLNGYLDNATFMKFNQKFRRKEELIEYENKIKESKNHATYLLDSLESKNLISENIYLYKKKELFYHKKKYSEINFSIKDSNDLHIDTYRGMLLNYTKSFVEPKNIKTSSGYIFNSKRAFDFVIKSDLFNQKSKEFLLWTYLKEIGNNFSKEDFLNYYQLFTEEVNDVKIVDDIKNQFLISLNSVNKKPYEVLLIDNSKVEITLNKIIKKNKEKVIYIDFWASWCTPCRSAMPASRKLKTEFKNKDVVFIYVSIDKNFDKWKKASEDEGLSFYKNNILAINYPNANFYKELDLKTIPRYILYDKKGKLVHQNAPGPEGEEIRKLFDKYLEE